MINLLNLGPDIRITNFRCGKKNDQTLRKGRYNNKGYRYFYKAALARTKGVSLARHFIKEKKTMHNNEIKCCY
jgi:hypothetical protein